MQSHGVTDDPQSAHEAAPASRSSDQVAPQTATPSRAKKSTANGLVPDQACLKEKTARCQQSLAHVNAAAAQCSQNARQEQYANDQQHGVVRQDGVYGSMSCGRDSGFYYPRCIADARKQCGFKVEMTAVQQQIEKLRQMGAK